MDDLIVDFLDGLEEELGTSISLPVFNRMLDEYGLMIVPVDDPTNLHLGFELDDLAD